MELYLTFYIKEDKITNSKLFLRNYKLLKSGDTKYILKSELYKVDRLKIVICNQTFEYDGLLFKKGNIYAGIIDDEVVFDIYELTGSWVTKGHNGSLFTSDAMREGMKGWHLRSFHEVYFSDINEKFLNEFLYREGEEIEK